MKKNTTSQQIKSFTDLLRGLGILASILIGLFCFESNPIFAIIIGAVGCYAAWASTLCLRGFGELIEDTTANREINEKILDILESQYIKQHGEPTTPQPPATWICKKCGTENKVDTDRDMQFCRECGYQTKAHERKYY